MFHPGLGRDGFGPRHVFFSRRPSFMRAGGVFRGYAHNILNPSEEFPTAGFSSLSTDMGGEIGPFAHPVPVFPPELPKMLADCLKDFGLSLACFLRGRFPL